MTCFFEYPEAARVEQVVPKNKIYEQAQLPKKHRKYFVDQVGQIIWQYKLAPETINLEATKTVSEIQIFKMNLRTATLRGEVLLYIDRAISFPIIFELYHAGRRKAIAAYKRPSQADRSKWVLSEYFETGWEAEDAPRLSLPHALDLNNLYEALSRPLLPVMNVNEPFVASVERASKIKAKRREIERIKKQRDKEVQYNKRVDINAALRKAKNELKRLGEEDSTTD